MLLAWEMEGFPPLRGITSAATVYSNTMGAGITIKRTTPTILRSDASMFRYSPSPPKTPAKTLPLSDLSNTFADVMPKG
jgi:hypothetical protein